MVGMARIRHAELEELRAEHAALTAERDALARTLATLAQAGIVVGEDGVPRWHGLTGAEVETAIALIREVIDNEHVYTVLNDSGIDACVFCHAEFDDDVDDGNPHDPDCWIVRADAALAAAAGRGAEGEAT
jgi:hypothetical protein